MDINSLAGLTQGLVNNHASWDIGGVSGDELRANIVSDTSENLLNASGLAVGGAKPVAPPFLFAYVWQGHPGRQLKLPCGRKNHSRSIDDGKAEAQSPHCVGS